MTWLLLWYSYVYIFRTGLWYTYFYLSRALSARFDTVFLGPGRQSLPKFLAVIYIYQLYIYISISCMNMNDIHEQEWTIHSLQISIPKLLDVIFIWNMNEQSIHCRYQYPNCWIWFYISISNMNVLSHSMQINNVIAKVSFEDIDW